MQGKLFRKKKKARDCGLWRWEEASSKERNEESWHYAATFGNILIFKFYFYLAQEFVSTWKMTKIIKE